LYVKEKNQGKKPQDRAETRGPICLLAYVLGRSKVDENVHISVVGSRPPTASVVAEGPPARAFAISASASVAFFTTWAKRGWEVR